MNAKKVKKLRRLVREKASHIRERELVGTIQGGGYTHSEARMSARGLYRALKKGDLASL